MVNDYRYSTTMERLFARLAALMLLVGPIAGCGTRVETRKNTDVLPYFAGLTVDEDSMKLSLAYAGMGVVARPRGLSKGASSPCRVTRFVCHLERSRSIYFTDTSFEASLTRAMIDTLRASTLPGDVLRISDIISTCDTGGQVVLDELRFVLVR